MDDAVHYDYVLNTLSLSLFFDTADPPVDLEPRRENETLRARMRVHV